MQEICTSGWMAADTADQPPPATSHHGPQGGQSRLAGPSPAATGDKLRTRTSLGPRPCYDPSAGPWTRPWHRGEFTGPNPGQTGSDSWRLPERPWERELPPCGGSSATLWFSHADQSQDPQPSPSSIAGANQGS